MIKCIPDGAWDFDGRQLELVKVASTGLSGEDFRQFVKRASHPLALWVRDNPPGPGGVYVHSHAMGSTEKYGANRNNDGYTEATLTRDHPTFETIPARWFYNHQNSNPDLSYGVVKKAWFNPEMGRVEVITELNATKEAAARNGGNIARKTLDKIARDEDVAVSMSCRVPFDRCVACGNQARHRGEYCTAAQCTKYGGCRDNLGRVFDDGFHLFVDNPKVALFDLSDVSDTRGADRTAFVTGKVASHPDRIPGGAELAEKLGLVPPDHLLEPATLAAVSSLRKLAALGPYPHPVCDWDTAVAVRSMNHALAATQAVPALTVPGDPFVKLADMAAAGVLLPPAEWLSHVTGVSRDKCAGAFAGGISVQHDVLDRPDLHELLSDSTLSQADSRVSAKYAHLAPTAEAHAAESVRAVVLGIKKASSTPAPEPVRKEAKARYLAYAGYVLGLHSAAENFPLLLAEARRHISARTA